MANVLILDDEESLLKVIASYLKRSGHSVWSCLSPESALTQFEELGGAIDLLIAGVTLADISGAEVGLALIGHTPELKILLVSGYPFLAWNFEDAESFHRLPSDSVRVLQKPFSPLDLLLKVDELIGRLPLAAPLVQHFEGVG
ncbi:MAG: response regulator [Candidatus Solibacter sp.]